MGMRSLKAILVSTTAVVTLLISMTFSTLRWTASATQSDLNADLLRDLTRLDSFIEHKNLAEIEQTVDQASAKWRQRDRQALITYMSKACNLLSSYDIGDNSKRASLLSRYSVSVLESEDLALRDQILFVNFLTFDPIMIREEEWKGLRRRKTELWLAARQRVANSIDVTFDFNDWAQVNVAPPRATGLPSGISPDAIKDPKLRAEYESAIAKNAAKAQRYNEQYWLKNNAPHFFEEAERYVVTAYTRPPTDMAELERLLAKYLDDNGVRARILDNVRKGSNSN